MRKTKKKTTTKKKSTSPLGAITKTPALHTEIEDVKVGKNVYSGDKLPPMRVTTTPTDDLLREFVMRRYGYVPSHGDILDIKVFISGIKKPAFKGQTVL